MLRFLVAFAASLCAFCLVASVNGDGSGEKQPVRKDLAGDPLPEGALVRMGTLRWRHKSNVNYVAYLTDGKSIITADGDQTIRLWDRETGKEIRRFTKPEKKGSGSEADIEENARQAMMVWGGGAQNMSVALAPDGKTLAAVYGSSVQFWDVGSGKPSGEIKGPAEGIGAISFAADSKMLVGRGQDRTTYVWEVDGGKEVAKVKIAKEDNQGGVKVFRLGGMGSGGAVMMSPDGKNLAWTEAEFDNGQPSNSLIIADRKTGKEVRRFKLDDNGSSAMAYSHDGKLLAYATSAGIHLCEADSDKELHLLKGHEGFMSLLAFSADGKTLMSRTMGDGKLMLWDPDKGEKLCEIEVGQPPAPAAGPAFFFLGAMTTAAHEVAFSPDGKTLAVGFGHVVRFFSTQTGKEVSKQEGHAGPVTDVRVAGDGKTIVSKGTDGTIRRWDAGTGKELSSFQAPAGSRCLAVSPDGKTIAFGNADNTVRLHDAETGKELHKLTGPEGGSAVVAFSRDGKTVAARGDGKSSIALFESSSGKEIKTIGVTDEKPQGGPAAIAFVGGVADTAAGPALLFSPDGSTLASFLPGTPAINGPGSETACAIELFHIGTGKSRRIELPKDQAPLNMIYSPDGRMLAIENADRTIALIETVSGQERSRVGKKEEKPATPGGPPGAMMVVAFGAPGMGAAAVAPKIAYSPDGRKIAIVRGEEIEIWDIAAAKCVKRIKGHEGSLTALAFAADGKRLVTGSSDTTLLLWDTSDLRSDKPAPDKLTEKQVEEAWANLEGNDGAKADKSIRELVGAPEQAAKWLQKNLSPAAPADSALVEKWIANLDNDDFETRMKAASELEKLGELAVPALEQTLNSKPSLETQKKIEELIEKTVGGFHTGNRLRLVRAIEVLEKIDTPEARKVLETLAKGAAGALPTREAQAALERAGK